MDLDPNSNISTTPVDPTTEEFINHHFNLLDYNANRAMYSIEFNTWFIYKNPFIEINIITHDIRLSPSFVNSSNISIVLIQGRIIVMRNYHNAVSNFNHSINIYTDSICNIITKYKQFLFQTYVDTTMPLHLIKTHYALHVDIIDIVRNYYLYIHHIEKPIRFKSINNYIRIYDAYHHSTIYPIKTPHDIYHIISSIFNRSTIQNIDDKHSDLNKIQKRVNDTPLFKS